MRSSYQRYLWQLLALCLLAAAIMPVVAWYDLTHCQEQPERLLMQYQLGKIDQLRDVDTVFVGDSSLGNAIDAGTFSKLSGKTAVNLALTGFHGYSASYNMIRRVIRHGAVRNVVVVQALDMMTRAPSYEGYAYSAQVMDLLDPRAFPFRELPSYLKALAGIFFNTQSLRNLVYFWLSSTTTPSWLSNDYIRQGPVRSVDEEKLKGLPTARIDLRNTWFLRKMAAYCREHDVNIVYMHGPTLDVRADLSGDYLRRVNDLIAQAGIPVVQQVVTLPLSMMGDSPLDHVAPENKAEATRLFWERLRGSLR